MSLRQDAFLDDRYVVRGLAWDYPDGQELPPHNHTWAQLVYADSGVMQVHTDAAAWLVPTTRAIWIPGGVSHWIRMRGQVRMRTLYVAGDLSGWPAHCQGLEVAPLLRELILYLVETKWLAPDNPRHARLRQLLQDLILESRDVPLVLPLPRDPRALALANRILNDPGEAASLAQLARNTAASLRTLQRAFKADTGVPLEVWRLRARMQQGIVMLSGGASVTETAYACGYANPSAFTAAFKRLFGVAPSRYGPTRFPNRAQVSGRALG